jgi:hypothetical protein
MKFPTQAAILEPRPRPTQPRQDPAPIGRTGGEWIPPAGRTNVRYRYSMAWGTVVPAIITAGAAFLGVGFGARLSKNHETLNWTREQRLKAYTELLGALEKCYEAFTLIAASLSLAKYDESARKDPKIINTATEWGKWDTEIDHYLPQAELVSSRDLQPYVMYIRLGMRSRHRVLLMQLAYGQEINRKEWESVSSMTHGDILEIRRRLRGDITHIDPAPSFLDPIMLRWRVTHRRITKRFGISRPNKRREPVTGGLPPSGANSQSPMSTYD